MLEAFNLSVLQLFWSMYSMQLVNICHQLLHAFFGSDFLSLAFHFVASLCTRFQVSDCSTQRAEQTAGSGETLLLPSRSAFKQHDLQREV